MQPDAFEFGSPPEQAVRANLSSPAFMIVPRAHKALSTGDARPQKSIAALRKELHLLRIPHTSRNGVMLGFVQ
jgi:hypothetical protein